jgi:rSAM/selenodomain-associated transferase 2
VISIIIPTLNEEGQIGKLITFLQCDSSSLIKEIIVVDAHSSDRTIEVAAKLGATVLKCKRRCRSKQLNLGAKQARGEILYFLHADTYPPTGFAEKIVNAIQQGYSFGCFRLRFDWKHWFLVTNSWFTRFRMRIFRFGDQSLFVTKRAFHQAGGYNEHFRLFEDHEIVGRLYKEGIFTLLPDTVITSARKYRENGPYRLQLVYFLLYVLYIMRFKQEFLIRTYLDLVPNPRI